MGVSTLLNNLELRTSDVSTALLQAAHQLRDPPLSTARLLEFLSQVGLPEDEVTPPKMDVYHHLLIIFSITFFHFWGFGAINYHQLLIQRGGGPVRLSAVLWKRSRRSQLWAFLTRVVGWHFAAGHLAAIHFRRGQTAGQRPGWSWNHLEVEIFTKHVSGWWLSHPSEKYERQLGDVGSIIPNIWKTCSKPPTSDIWRYMWICTLTYQHPQLQGGRINT